MANPAQTIYQNILPVQAYFAVDGTFQTFIGQGQPFYATVNPIQSGLTITSSTLDSSPVGASVPSTGAFTNLSTNTGQITTTPTASLDIVNKSYVDNVAAGLSVKAPCLVASTANIPTLSGLLTIDGVTLVAGNRVLVKNQTTQADNGIYVVSATAWSRATDMSTWAQVPGAFTFVETGTQADTGWVCTSDPGGTVGVTAITFVQFSSAGTYTAGTGLTLTGTQFSITNTTVNPNSYGSASSVGTFTVNAQGQLTAASNTAIAIAANQITSGTISSSLVSGSYTGITGVGTLTAGTWNGSTIGVAYGGTGATTLTGYVKGSGTSAFTASSTIPNTDITGLGTMSTQNANAVAITGGTISGLTSPLGVASGGTGAATLTGYVKASGVSAFTASATIPSSDITGLGTMSTQNASSVAITGGTMSGVAISGGTISSLASPLAVASGGTGVTSSTGTVAVVLSNSPTLVTPILGTPQSVTLTNGTGLPLTTGVTGTLPVANGGTNATATPTAGAVSYGTGTAYAFTSAGTSGQVLQSNGASAPTWVTPTAYASVTDDTTTNATRYPLFASVTTGNLTTEYVASTKYQFNPSTGTLTATVFSGSGASLTNIPNSALTNSSITIGSTSVSLGATATTLAGLTSVTSTTFVGALSGNASTATTATNATNTATTDDTTTNATVYPVWKTNTTGNLGEYVSSTKLKFNPSTGALTASQLIIAP